MNFSLRIIQTLEELEKEEIRFRDLSISEKDEFFDNLYRQFQEVSYKTDWETRYSYFRWFTELSWRRFLNRDTDFLINFVFKRQIPLALLLDINVMRNLLNYFRFKPLGIDNLLSVYGQIRQSFLDSEAIIGVWDNQLTTQKEVIQKIKSVNLNQNSLEYAEMLIKLKNSFFPKNEFHKTYIHSDQNEVVEKFIDLSNFFIGVDSDKIFYIVDAYENEAKYEIMMQSQENKVINSNKNLLDSPQTSPNISTSNRDQSTDILKDESQQTATSPEDNNIQTQISLKQTIDAQFETDSTGQYIDLAGVMAKLHELAVERNDPSIEEAYVFDEETGRFEWDERFVGEDNV